MKKKKKPNRRSVMLIVSAIAILVIAVTAAVISVGLTRPSNRFECEKAVLYEADGTTLCKVSRLKDRYASAGAVAGYTGGKIFEFRNCAQGNCVHIAYASESVTLEAAALAFADGETNMVVEPGDFMLWVAEDSADDRYGFVFTVEP